jgi:hypothetical protein
VTAPAPKKRSPAEAWKALEDRWADDEEAERIAALSPEQLDREMETLGVDVEAQRIKGRELAAEVKRAHEVKGAHEAKAHEGHEAKGGGSAKAVAQQERPPRSERKAVPLRGFGPLLLLAAAFVMVCLGVAAIAGIFQAPEPDPEHRARPDQPYEPPTAPETPPESRAAAARRFRHEAEDACATRQWQTCIERLNAAEDRDPALVYDPDMWKLRAQANAVLERKTPLSDGG